MLSFFGKKAFALYITDDFVQVMQIGGKKEQQTLDAVGYKQLATGVVVQGEIKQKPVLAQIIQQLLQGAKPKPITENQCIVILGEAQSFEHIFNFPKVLENDALEIAVSQKVSANIPIPFESVQYDYFSHIFNETRVVFSVAVKKTVIEAYDGFLKEDCHLKPVALEPEAVALMRIARFPAQPGQGAVLIYVRENTLNWFWFLDGLIFDSNFGSIQNVGALVQDLKKTAQFFHDVTGKNTYNIFVTGIAEKADELLKSLQPFIPIPINKLPSLTENLAKFDLKAIAELGPDLSSGKFDIVYGAACKFLIETEQNLKFNLLKK